MRPLLPLAFLLFSFFTCRKELSPPGVTGQWIWTLQYSFDSAYNATPQSTGIREILSFDNNGGYSVARNGITTSSGTYQLSMATGDRGVQYPLIHYTNARVTDSSVYYNLSNNNDSLSFSYQPSGTYNSIIRHYGRQ